MKKVKNLIKIKCKYCGLTFTTGNSNRKFCSRKCYWEFRKEHYILEQHPQWNGGKKEKECPVCKNKFRSYSGKYCSKSCAMKDRMIGNKYSLGRKHSKEEIAKRIKTRLKHFPKYSRCKKEILRGGYFKVLNPTHRRSDKDGYIYKQVFVMEEKIGRFLRGKELVHHINGIRIDNRPENLYLFSDKSKHAVYEGNLHRTYKKWIQEVYNKF